MSAAAQTQKENKIEACAAAFEAAWFQNGEAQVADHLPPPEAAHYYDALVELACIELELDWARGKRRLVEDSLHAFPALRGDLAAIAALAQQEYESRLEAGEAYSLTEYQRRLGVSVTAAVRRHDPAAALTGTNRPAWRERIAQLYLDRERSTDAESGPSELASWSPNAGGSELAPGSEIAGFHLVRELGRGTFGRVFLAEQTGLAGRPVVLKVGSLLYDESQHLAQLQHTNIVPIYSAHRVGDAQALCMPYLGSTTLADILAVQRREYEFAPRSKALWSTLNEHSSPTEPFRPDHADCSFPESASVDSATAGLATLRSLPRERAALLIGLGLAEGLAHAHDRGIVHRDLKPANVLLADDGTALLLDFNLAADPRGPDGQRALVGGTLPYMAPEQLAALLEAEASIDGRSDIYALGVILFEFLAGRRPFSHHVGPRREVMQRMLADRHSGPPDLHRAVPRCSRAVAAIVGRCLAANPNQRYLRAHDLAEDLKRQLDDLPLKHAPEPSLFERTSKLVRRRPRTVGIVAASLLAILAISGAVAAIGQARRARQAEAITARQALQDELTDARTLLSLPFPSVEEVAEGQALCAQALARFGLPTNADWRPTQLVQALGRADRSAVQQELAEILLLAARGAWLKTTFAAAAGERESGIASALALNAQAEQLSLDPAAAQFQRARLALVTNLATQPETWPVAADSQAQLPDAEGWIAGELAAAGRFQDACRLLDAAIRRQPQNAALWAQLGACQSALGRTREAVASYSTCIALRPSLWRIYFWRGQANLEFQEFSQAVWDFDRVLAGRPNHVPSLALRALAHLGQQDLDAAESDLTQALALAPDHTRLYFMRSRVRHKRADAAGAQRDLDEGLKREPTDELSWIARGLARLRAHPEGALADFDAALELNPWSREAAQNKAHVLSERLGKTEDAIAVLDPLVARYPDLVVARVGRGVLLARLGRREAARLDAAESLSRDQRPLVLYQVACIHALNARSKPADAAEALGLLQRAIREGFGADLLERDPDLAAIRDLAEFRRLVGGLGGESAPPSRAGGRNSKNKN